MDHAILPLDVIVRHIARVRPGALRVCVGLCKAIYEALQPDLEQLQTGWLRCEKMQRNYRYSVWTIYKLTRWVNPNGSYHGEFKIMEEYEDKVKPLFIGNFKNGAPHGQFIKYWNTTKLLDATYVDGKLHGEHIVTGWKRSKIYVTTTTYHHGKKHGRYTKQLDDKLIHECYYEMNVRHGREIEWFESGAKKLSQTWNRGRLHGWVYECNEDGPVESTLYHYGREIVDFDGDIARMMNALET